MSCTIQTSYVFIPGKNWILSLAELVSFLEARNYGFKIHEFSDAFFALTMDRKFAASAIADLGGTIKVGRTVADLLTETVTEAFLRKNKQAQEQVKASLYSSSIPNAILENSSAKSLFGISIYCGDNRFLRFSKTVHRFLGSAIKEELAVHGKKSRFMGFPKKRAQPQLIHIEVLKKGLVESKSEILFCVGKRQTLIATTIAVHDPFQFQKRDIERPVQRRIFSIPPRLAKIMINLASCKTGQTFLDPFCGVGTILQEALLTKAQTIGADINPWCTEAARKNLEWLRREYSLQDGNYEVLQADSRQLSKMVGEASVDCIATEPDLGPALRHLPTLAYARKIVEKLQPLYFDFIGEAYRVLKPNGRLVLVTPYIKTRNNQPVTLDVEEKAKATGFRAVYPFQDRSFAEKLSMVNDLIRATSFVEIGERHKIGREIHVFQKAKNQDIQ